MANITIDPIALNNAIDILEGATLTLSTAEHCGLASEIGDVRDLLQNVKNALVAESDAYCWCGCDALWTDTSSDEYLNTHFECDRCEGDHPMKIAIVDFINEGEISLICPNCSSN
jgi:hypothetical protein